MYKIKSTSNIKVVKYLSVAIIVLSTLGQVSLAQSWYVNGLGDDNNDGRTLKTAFRSLQKAADVVIAGQTVWIGDGIYTSTDLSGGGSVLGISKSGRPDAWITWKAMAGTHPELRPIGWGGIVISGSYHIFDGLTVMGNNDAIVLADAQADAKKPVADGRFNTNGIFVNGRTRKPEEKPHHIVIKNCVVGKCPGGGITAIEADYITIEDCKIFENAWFMRYGGSGISTLTNWAFDDAPGYHNVVQRNFVWGNRTMVFWEKVGRLSDGNGIIMDVTDQEETQGATNPNGDAIVTQTPAVANQSEKPKRPEWKGRTLVANNLCAFNGGSGIHTFRARHVDILNNTTYWNGQMVGYPELFANRSEDIVILNNIIVPRPSGKVTSNNRNTNVRWDYNLYPTPQQIMSGPHDIIADPGFIDIQMVITKGNFRQSKKSPGIDAGTNEKLQLTDITGAKRPKGKGIDIGAYEQ